MSTLKAYLDLSRVSNLPTIWTNVLAACVLATGQFATFPYVILALALSSFYLAGMCLNDICDAAHDRQHQPARPIPAGRVSIRGAMAFTLALFAAGLLLVLGLFPDGLAAAAALVFTIVIYDRHHKRNPWSVLLMASCRGLVFVVASMALTGFLPGPVLVAAALQFLYVVSISLVARRENAGVRPFPFPVIPAMIAGISLVDGMIMAVLLAPSWLAAGIAGSLLTWAGQRYIRGD